MQKQKQRHEFDEYIQEYRDNQTKGLWLSGETSEFFAEYKVQKMLSWFPEYNKNGMNILDFGCGDGLMTQYTKQYFSQASIFGIDPSSDSIAVAQNMYGNAIHFSSFIGKKLPYADQTFNLIFAAGVFHHIPFEDHACFIKELHRITKRGGRIILFELNPLNPLTQYTFKKSPIEKNARMLYPWYSKKLLLGLGEINTKYYCFFPSFAKKVRPLEPYMTWVPIGALYATIVKVS